MPRKTALVRIPSIFSFMPVATSAEALTISASAAACTEATAVKPSVETAPTRPRIFALFIGLYYLVNLNHAPTTVPNIIAITITVPNNFNISVQLSIMQFVMIAVHMVYLNI